jgi:hypothetical protein
MRPRSDRTPIRVPINGQLIVIALGLLLLTVDVEELLIGVEVEEVVTSCMTVERSISWSLVALEGTIKNLRFSLSGNRSFLTQVTSLPSSEDLLQV